MFLIAIWLTKAVDTYPSALLDISNFYKIQKMCETTVGTCHSCHGYKIHKKCDKVVSKEYFMLKNCLNKYKSQEMCKVTVDASLPLLKFVPYWFVTNKMFTVFFNGDIVFFHVDSDNMTVFNDDMGLINADLKNISLNDDNFDEDDDFMSDLWFGIIQISHARHAKRKSSKELIPVASHPTSTA